MLAAKRSAIPPPRSRLSQTHYRTLARAPQPPLTAHNSAPRQRTIDFLQKAQTQCKYTRAALSLSRIAKQDTLCAHQDDDDDDDDHFRAISSHGVRLLGRARARAVCVIRFGLAGTARASLCI